MAIPPFVAGVVLTAAELNVMAVAIEDGYTIGSYTPTLTGMAVGAGGTNTAAFTFGNGRLTVEGTIVFGTSGQTFPTSPTVALPAGYTITTVTANRPCGLVLLNDVSTGARFGRSKVASSTAVSIVYDSPSGTLLGEGPISPTAPFTWANGDAFLYEFTVRVTGP